MNVKRILKSGLVVVGGVLMAAGPALADGSSALSVTIPTVDTTLYATALGGIVAALAMIWPARKLIKLFNKS